MASQRNRAAPDPARDHTRERPGHPLHQRFMIGKYEVVARPIPGSAHMLRYTVFVNGKRIGAMASMPTESDCKYLEAPPPVPPLKPFYVSGRPGRPPKGSPPRNREGANESGNDDA